MRVFERDTDTLFTFVAPSQLRLTEVSTDFKKGGGGSFVLYELQREEFNKYVDLTACSVQRILKPREDKTL